MGSGSALSVKSTAGSFLIAPDTLATALTACALSVIAARCHTPPFVAARHLPPERGKSFLKGRGKSTAGNFATPETTPSVIACGDATFPKGTALAVAGNFAAAPKGAPLGELAANVVSRLRGFYPQN